MSASLVASYGLAVIGLALIASAAFVVLKSRLRIDLANAAVIRLLKSGDLDRARKLCRAAPGSILDAIGAAIAAVPAGRDRVTVADATHRAFDELARPWEQRWRAVHERGFFGALLVAAALGLVWGATPLPIWIAAGVAGLATLWLLSTRSHATTAVASVRDTVLPEIVGAAAAKA